MSAIICSFSSPVAELPRKKRTAENVMACLKEHPRVSCWDMMDNPLLCSIIKELERQGKIIDDKKEAYPWHRFKVVEK